MIARTLAAAAALLLAGCSALFIDHDARRKAYVEANPGMTARARASVLGGYVSPGMTKNEVRASWGHPIDRDRFVSAYGVRETWTYGHKEYAGGAGFVVASNYVTFEDGVVVSVYSP